MNLLNNEEISPPPGIISSIKAGFDITANKIGIILFPVLLDIFLWLGPQLRIEKLIRLLLVQYSTLSKDSFVYVFFSATDIENIQKSLAELLTQNINLFSFLRTIPIGINSLFLRIFPIENSLMRRAFHTESPLGELPFHQVNSFFEFSLWVSSLTFIGWILGSLYFALVARATIKSEDNNLLWVGKTIAQTTLLALILMIAFFAIGTPFQLLFVIFIKINASLAQISLIFLMLFAMWIIVPIFFSAHGIFVKSENLFRSMVSSFNLSRFTLPTSSFFVLVVAMLSYGFNLLWLTPSTSSWMMGVSILGHAFITTSLLAASFIYYRDMNAWLETLLEKLNSKKATSAQA